MPGDYSRTSLNPTKKYSAVLAQQGRVQLDSDWNEQVGLQEHRVGVETIDVIGPCGTPRYKNGFLLAQTPRGADLLIPPGRFYVSGLLCELDPEKVQITFPAGSTNQIILPNLWLDETLLQTGQWVEVSADQQATPLLAQITSINSPSLTLTLDVSVTSYQNAGTAWIRRVITYATQPFFPVPDFTVASPASGPYAVHLDDGDYLAFIKARKRELNALEDHHIREVALDGPDTCTREQIVWQVHLKMVSPLSSPPAMVPDCSNDFPAWDQEIAPMTGQMNARTKPPQPNQNPCALPPTAGFQRLDNQNYRVEIFQGGATRELSTIVWSRDNGMVETTILSVDDDHIVVSDLGKDDLHSFAAKQWVEIVDPEGDLQGSPRFLAQITDPPDPSSSTIKLSVSASLYSGRSDLRLRRWDMTDPAVTPQGLPITSGYMDLESGVQVSFTEGSYETHAYWQVPARTATGDIEWPPFQVPNDNPISQPPLGYMSHYCRLALIEVRGGIWAIYDCRKQFPALTNICADDVCYESACDDFKDADTVQKALDELCHSRDLRFHNQHLHGWGIVCGMEVVCGPDGPSGPREQVTVNSGYAIDCNGNDIILEQNHPLNVFDMIPASPPGSIPPDNDYSLILDPSVDQQFRFVTYQPETFLQSLFDGSILLDFYNDCIKNVIDLFTGAFTSQPNSSTQLVTPAQQRIDTFTNLIAQYLNPDTGSYVYISGYQPNATPPTEDFIIRDFYNQLKSKLQSETYCAMYDRARAFPDYPFTQLKVSSIYSLGFKTNLRVDPTGARAYTFGVDNNIYVFDLSANQINSIIQFPAAGVVVRDVAFSTNGNQVYAVASLNNQETMFAIADVAAFQHTWRAPGTIICNMLISTLVMLASDANNVYALEVGNGIYQINIANPSTPPNLVSKQFCAFGHLVVDDVTGFAYATLNSTTAIGQAPTTFDQVQRINLRTPGTSEVAYVLPTPGTASDDIAIVSSQSVPEGRLFVTTPTGAGITSQQLVTYSGTSAAPVAISIIPLGGTTITTIRLAHNPVTQMMMLSFEDGNRIKITNQEGDQKILINFSFPTEYQPFALTYSAAGGQVFVLNYGSNTISVIPAKMFVLAQQIDLNQLLLYRTAVIDAFLDLLGGFLQYLKDCFCDHILVKCPSCYDSDVLYLGTVSIRNGQISKICNFAQRKYVKSFPTVQYWLSLIPIIPLIRTIVEKLCCAALPEYFGTLNAPQPSAAVTSNPVAGAYMLKMPAGNVHGAITTIQKFSISKSLTSALSNATLSKSFASDYFQGQARKFVLPPAGVSSSALVGQDPGAAKAVLENSNIKVDRVVQSDPLTIGQNFKQFLSNPASVPPNSSVTLVTSAGGKVIGVVPASPDVADLRTSLATNQQQLAQASQQITQTATLSQQLNTRLTANEQALAASKATLDNVSVLQQQYVELQAKLTAMQDASTTALAARDKTIGDLQAMVQQLSTQINRPIRGKG